MRIVIEIGQQQRAKLLELAEGRKERGLSAIVSEAVEQYLQTLDSVDAQRRIALKLRGSLSRHRAEGLRERIAAIRNSWR